MKTTTLVSEIALSVALVQITYAQESDIAQDLAVYAAKHEIASDEQIAIVAGGWLAHGWIEQDTTSTIEELRDGDPERFELAAGDFDAIKAIFAALAAVFEDQADQFSQACQDAAREAWETHYKGLHAAYDLGVEHGTEHAESWVTDWRREPTETNDPNGEPTEDELRADYDHAIKTLAKMSTTANDWSTSAAEGWALKGRRETGADDEPEHIQEEIRYWYVAGYEAGARQRSGELASELADE